MLQGEIMILRSFLIVKSLNMLFFPILTPAPSNLGNIIEEVIHPCNPNPCPSNHLCEVNRKGCQPGQDCLPYLCVPGTVY